MQTFTYLIGEFVLTLSLRVMYERFLETVRGRDSSDHPNSDLVYHRLTEVLVPPVRTLVPTHLDFPPRRVTRGAFQSPRPYNPFLTCL